MTSNIGADTILENFEDLDALGEKHRGEVIETTKEELLNLLKQNLRPEFLNRIDERIMFLPLTKEEIAKIFFLQIKSFQKLLDKKGITMTVSPEATDFMVNLGYDPQYGARPMKRVIQKELVNPLAKHLLADDFLTGDHLQVTLDETGTALSFSSAPPILDLPEEDSDSAA